MRKMPSALADFPEGNSSKFLMRKIGEFPSWLKRKPPQYLKFLKFLMG
jgi:hypothetical protein